jgi:hypothetical protein
MDLLTLLHSRYNSDLKVGCICAPFLVEIPCRGLHVPGRSYNFLLTMAMQSCNRYRLAFIQLPQLTFIIPVDHWQVGPHVVVVFY